VWLSSPRAVTSVARAASAITVVAANGFDTDARWNIVSGVTGSPVRTSRTPNPRITISTPCTTATASPASPAAPPGRFDQRPPALVRC
jgi:hypothetical protein